MVDQAKIAQTNGESPPQAAARNVAELLHDVLTLADLQSRLLGVEIQQELQRITAPAAVLVSGIILALSCLPLGLVCIALVLEEATDLSHAQAFVVTLLGGVVLAASLILASIWYLRKRIRLLERSRTEWNLNVRWVRGVLKRLASSSGKPSKLTTGADYRC